MRRSGTVSTRRACEGCSRSRKRTHRLKGKSSSTGSRSEADPAPQQEYILKVRRLKALSGGLPIWNTETNIGGMQPEAAALERLIKVNHEAGVEAVFYYYLDQGSPEHPENMADGNGGVKLWARAYGRFR